MMESLRANHAVHARMADDLQRQIAEGRLRPGDRILSERKLCDQYGLSRTAVRAALEGLAATLYHDMIFSGPMAGSGRIFPAVAMADAFTATLVFAETGKLPAFETHPLNKLFPEFAEQLGGL